MISLRTPLLLSGLLLSAACTQPSAQVENKGMLFYGQQQIVTVGNTVPGQQPAQIAAKYQGADYAKPTPLADVEVATIAEPQPVEVLSLDPVTPEVAEPSVALLQPLETLPMKVSDDTNLANSTFSWPIEGPILSHFGPKSGGLVNDGINISASIGEPIWASAGGEVAYAGSSVADYGNMIIVRHNNGWMSAYGHASDLLVKKGDKIAQGDLLGYVGQTGNVTEPQLHFGLRQGDKPVDPMGLLPRRVASVR